MWQSTFFVVTCLRLSGYTIYITPKQDQHAGQIFDLLGGHFLRDKRRTKITLILAGVHLYSVYMNIHARASTHHTCRPPTPVINKRTYNAIRKMRLQTANSRLSFALKWLYIMIIEVNYSMSIWVLRPRGAPPRNRAVNDWATFYLPPILGIR